jgi:AraC-like DNA-binding protein
VLTTRHSPVSSFFSVERYSHVMHLVSTVTGRLAAGRTAFDAVTACFPAGTLSGANQSPRTVEEIGRRLGYAATPAFTTAFKRWKGVPPRAYVPR